MIEGIKLGMHVCATDLKIMAHDTNACNSSLGAYSYYSSDANANTVYKQRTSMSKKGYLFQDSDGQWMVRIIIC